MKEVFGLRVLDLSQGNNRYPCLPERVFILM
jgi:hypothetical protein